MQINSHLRTSFTRNEKYNWHLVWFFSLFFHHYYWMCMNGWTVVRTKPRREINYLLNDSVVRSIFIVLCDFPQLVKVQGG